MTTLAHDRESTRRALGAGFYGLADLRLFLAISGKRQDAERALPWLTRALNPVSHRPKSADYSFSDLISLFVVRELRKKGVRASDIRTAESYLRKKWKTDRPFVSDEIQTDGRRVFVEDEVISGQIESADLEGQQVMREMVKDRLSSVHYNEGAAAYWTPMQKVLVDPRVQFGEPVIAGTRIPTGAVADIARRGGLEGAADQLGVDLSAARAAISFENKLAALRG
ncbi:MAG: hypothetical protein QOJ97_2543 [Solirubrobacteraceae bacterium]|jgi:uncharacterized protein (DUF433 family)|nr:hypothetical protein [Solirubrobacteraceae bacterium]